MARFRATTVSRDFDAQTLRAQCRDQKLSLAHPSDRVPDEQCLAQYRFETRLIQCTRQSAIVLTGAAQCWRIHIQPLLVGGEADQLGQAIQGLRADQQIQALRPPRARRLPA